MTSGPWERRSRTLFAQHGIQVEEVARELDSVRRAIGSAEVVRRFVLGAWRDHGGTAGEGEAVELAKGQAPRALLEAAGVGAKPVHARFELPVGVSYACAPKRVIELLEDVARSNPQILKHPAPQCLFMGYGDSSINFELRAWTDQFANFVTIRSELNSAIYDAVHAAGMSFPFPQREVRLLNESKNDSSDGPPSKT